MAGLSVVCLNAHNYLGRGDEYVYRLRAGVERHLKAPHTFRVFTEADLPKGVTGWWGKIALFRDGMLPDGERVIFFDLDTIITGSLADLAAYRGRLAMLSDFHFPWQHASGVMLWEAGRYGHIWSEWESAGRPEMRQGDQMWIRFMEPKAARLQELFPGQIRGLKTECVGGMPEDARVVCYHGQPKCHQNNWLPYLEKNT